ncbi:MAG: hypothetical protein R3242_04140, partial [Akkermansiaceae bacterium]|nr:hypothetical protein [Akkermansiaceae bacterium]
MQLRRSRPEASRTRPVRMRPLRILHLCLCLLALTVWEFSKAAELPDELLSGLADNHFEAREAAQEKLLQWAREHADESPTLIFTAYHASKDPE